MDIRRPTNIHTLQARLAELEQLLVAKTAYAESLFAMVRDAEVQLAALRDENTIWRQRDAQWRDGMIPSIAPPP